MKTLKYTIKSVTRKIKDWWKYVDIAEVLIATLFFILILCLAIMLYAFVVGLNRPTFELKRDDWVCTQTTTVQTTMLVGKVMIPQTRTNCVQYTKTP